MDLLILFLLLCQFGVLGASEEYSEGRTYILNPVRLSWDKALTACQEMNGSLAIIRSMATIPNLDIKGNWTFWIGVHRNAAKSKWERIDGNDITFFNWRWDLLRTYKHGKDCVVSNTLLPYSWGQYNCLTELPSLCELKQGDCRYIEYTHSGLLGHNRQIVLFVSLDVCLEMCTNETKYVCKSFLYDPHQHVCTLTDSERFTNMGDFRPKTDQARSYYHRTCDTGYVLENASQTPLYIHEPTPVLTTSSEVMPSPSVTCVELKTFAVNESVPVLKEIKVLQSLGETLKKQASNKKKISVPDKRPSSTYIGSFAIIITAVCLGFLVMLDLVSIPRYCRHNACCGDFWVKNKLKKGSPRTRQKMIMHHHFKAMKKHMRVIAMEKQANMLPEDDSDLDLDDIEMFNRYDDNISNHSFTNDLFMNGWAGSNRVYPEAKSYKYYDWSVGTEDVVSDSPHPEPKSDLPWPDDVIYDEAPVIHCKYVDKNTQLLDKSFITTRL